MKLEVVHTAICMRTKENAEKLFGNLLGLSKLKEFKAGPDIMNNLFGTEQEVEIIQYNTGTFDIEVFIVPPPDNNIFPHICLAVENREDLVKNAENMGCATSRHQRPDGTFIVFIKDWDGNRYEIKEI